MKIRYHEIVILIDENSKVRTKNFRKESNEIHKYFLKSKDYLTHTHTDLFK